MSLSRMMSMDYPANLIARLKKFRVYTRLDQNYSTSDLDRIVETELDPEEQKLIFLRYKHHLILKNIGIRMGISQERVRQIETNALMKISRNKLFQKEGKELS